MCDLADFLQQMPFSTYSQRGLYLLLGMNGDLLLVGWMCKPVHHEATFKILFQIGLNIWTEKNIFLEMFYQMKTYLCRKKWIHKFTEAMNMKTFRFIQVIESIKLNENGCCKQ